MNTVIETSSSKISKAGKDIDTLLQTVPTLINELEEALQRLDSCWDGPAWSEFQLAAAQDIDDLKDAYRFYKILAECMEKSSQEYHRSEQDVCQKIKFH